MHHFKVTIHPAPITYFVTAMEDIEACDLAVDEYRERLETEGDDDAHVSLLDDVVVVSESVAEIVHDPSQGEEHAK